MTELIISVEPIVYGGPSWNGLPSLKVCAKRYTCSAERGTEGLTLLFAHCVGGRTYKEQWELVIRQLFHRQSLKAPRNRIRAAVSFDWQNHGDAAVLNEHALKESRSEGVSIREWAAGMASYVQTHLAGHRIVALGHSAGATAITLLTKLLPYPASAVILVEPTLITKEIYDDTREPREAVMKFIQKGTLTRRNTWDTREHAKMWLGKRIPWMSWDPRALQLYVDHALMRDQTHDSRVILKGDRTQEACSYQVPPQIEGIEHITVLCRVTPVHVLLGATNDVVEDYVQDSLQDASAGRFIASLKRIEDAGHMVVQEKPDALAEAIGVILDGISDGTPGSTAKL